MSLISDAIDALNNERQKKNLRSLTPNDLLMRAAQQHAEFMDRTQTLTHKGTNEPAFGQRIRNTGYICTYEEENVAWTTGGGEEVVKLWMSDKPHRDNILNPRITELGLGVSPLEETGDAMTARYWALDLAPPPSSTS